VDDVIDARAVNSARLWRCERKHQRLWEINELNGTIAGACALRVIDSTDVIE